MPKTSIILITAFLAACLAGQTACGQYGSLLRKAGGAAVKHSPKIVKCLPEKEIARLAPMAKTPGQLGKEVGKLKLSEAARADTFMRIAVKNGVIDTAQEAAVRKMGNVEGLASLLSKINSSNANQARGHLKELQIGIACQNRGGRVVAFGRKFGDGVKKGDTDLDLLVEMKGKRFAIESKAYQSEIGTDMVRADLQSLKHYCNKIEKGTTPVFCFDKAPPELVQKVLKSENVKYLTGTGEEICIKLEVLAR